MHLHSHPPATSVRARSRTRTTIVAALSTMLATLALTATLTTATAAASGPNGCGPADGIGAFIPNAPLGNDFLEACNSHDICYDSGSSRSVCDNQFKVDLASVCEASPRFGCGFLAWFYGKMVELAGQGAWDRAQAERAERFNDELQDCPDADCEQVVAETYDRDVDELDLPPIEGSGQEDYGDPGSGDTGDAGGYGDYGDYGGSGDDGGDGGSDDYGDGGSGDYGGSGGSGGGRYDPYATEQV